MKMTIGDARLDRMKMMPLPDESLDGFIARFAAQNRFDRAIDITRAVGATHPQTPTVATRYFDRLGILAAELGVPGQELQARSFPLTDAGGLKRSFFGVAIDRTHLEIRHRRFSPAGLMASNHHRASWHLRYFPFCEESWELLTDTCQRCGTRQDWHHTLGLELCPRCCKDLRQGTRPTVPEELRASLAAASGLLHWDPVRRESSLALLPAEVSSGGSGDAYDLMIRLLPVIDNTLSRRKPRSLALDNAMPLINGVATAWEMLVGWPDSFDDFTSSLVASRRGRGGDGNNGATLALINVARNSPHESTQLLRKLAARYDLSKTKASDRRIYEAELARNIQQSDEMSLIETANALSINTTEVTMLRRNGDLTPRFGVRGKRTVPLFQRRDVEELRSLRKDRRDLSTTAQDLGSTCYAVDQLMDAGLLQRLTHRYFDLAYKEPQLSLASVGELIRRIEAKAVPLENTVELRLAARAIGGRLKPWGAIVQALLDGTIEFTVAPGDMPILARVRVSPSITQQLTKMNGTDSRGCPLHVDMMTKRDAEEVLNVVAGKAPQLSAVAVKNVQRRCIPVPALLEIATSYISAVEVASRVGRTVAETFRLLDQHGLRIAGSSLMNRPAVEKALRLR